MKLHLEEIDKFYNDLFAIDVLAAAGKPEGPLLVDKGVPPSFGTTRMVSLSIGTAPGDTGPCGREVTADERDDGSDSSEDGWTVVPSDFQAGK